MDGLHILTEDDTITNIDEVAREILSLAVSVAETVYPIAEIEFYVTDARHPDPFTHGAAEQYTRGFYLHRTGTSTDSGYKNGSYKGLDIALGGEGRAAGVLIRSVMDGDGVVEGPCKCVELFMDAAECISVQEFGEALPLALVPGRRLEIFRSSRIGLTLAKGGTRPEYINRPYRYFTNPNLIKHGKREMVKWALRDGHDNIAATYGVTKKYVDRF